MGGVAHSCAITLRTPADGKALDGHSFQANNAKLFEGSNNDDENCVQFGGGVTVKTSSSDAPTYCKAIVHNHDDFFHEGVVQKAPFVLEGLAEGPEGGKQHIAKHYKERFSFMLIHALYRSDDETATKFDIFLASNMEQIKERVALASDSEEYKKTRKVFCTDFEPVAATANMTALFAELQHLLLSSFLYDEDYEKKMALQQYHGCANCKLAARRLEALFCGFVSREQIDVFIEEYFHQERGELLQGVDLDDVEGGVPCTNRRELWTNVEPAKQVCGRGIIFLQKRKNEEGEKDLSDGQLVHSKKYRIVVDPENARQWDYRFREVARSNDERSIRGQLEELLAAPSSSKDRRRRRREAKKA